MTIWFTGLSGAGKTTIAKYLANILRAKNLMVEVLDGDELRQGLCKDLGYSREDRRTQVERVTFLSNLLSRNGVITLVALISPYKEDRQWARKSIESLFLEVFVDCPLSTCIERDVKGLYKKALAGDIPGFTGVSAPYEPPTHPDIHLKTNEMTVKQCADCVLNKLVKIGIIPESWGDRI